MGTSPETFPDAGFFPASAMATGEHSRRYKARFQFPLHGDRVRDNDRMPVKLYKSPVVH
jgi:hypothetical protein